MQKPHFQTIDTVVVGGGQAGLSVSYYLQRAGVEHVVLERHQPGYAWRHQRWDSFCLVTPNWQCQLPDFPYQGPDPKGFMVKDDIVAYVQAFAQFVDPPLHTGVSVQRVWRRDAESLVVESDQGVWHARRVIMAIGANHIAKRLPVNLPDHIYEEDALHYRNPQSLPPGKTLIIGTGQSGCQIAEDLHLAGRSVALAVGTAPRAPRRYRGKDVVEWLDQIGHYDLTINEHPMGAAAAFKTNHYVSGRDGGHDIDLRAFACAGMELFGRLDRIDGQCAYFSDDLGANLDQADAAAAKIKATIDEFITASGIDAPAEPSYQPPWRPRDDHPRQLDLSTVSSVIWAMGLAAKFDFIDLPVFDERGLPQHQRGLTSDPGLAFVGLPWQYTWGSGRFASVANDAEFVVGELHASAVSEA